MENFEEEETANSESNSQVGEELSWNEMDAVNEDDVYYDSPFDELKYAKTLV